MSGGDPPLPDEEDAPVGSTALVPLEVGAPVDELEPLVVLVEVVPVDITPVDATPVDVVTPVPVSVAKLGGES